jgi:hypothetical protein
MEEGGTRVNPKERLEALEYEVRALQVELAKMTMDIHMLKLLNKILSEVEK